MINQVVLVGRLTKDPELKYTPSGNAVSNFTLAVNRPFKNQQGENEADFVQCVAWRKQAESLVTYMKKGSLIGITGRIETRNFEGKDGRRVYVTEVVAESIQFLESRGSREETAPSMPTRKVEAPEKSMSNTNKFKGFGTQKTTMGDIDDDLPF